MAVFFYRIAHHKIILRGCALYLFTLRKKSRRDRKSPVSGWRSIFYRRAQSWKKEDDSLDGHDDSLG